MRRAIFFIGIVAVIPAYAQTFTNKLFEFEGKGPALTPSIAINNKEVNNIVVAVANGKAYYSIDDGAAWKESSPKSDFGFYGEPALLANSKGDIFLLHSSNPGGQGPSSDAWLDRIVCQHSKDNGASWEIAGDFGNEPPKDQLRPLATSSVKKHVGYASWAQFDKYESSDQACTSNIYFSMSSNGGRWSKPVQINKTPGDCLDGDKSVRGAGPAISYGGRLYMAWANQGLIYLDRSYDGGATWLSNDLAICPQEGGWTFNIPGFGKTTAAPSLAIDASPGKFHGTISIAFADQKNGENDTDIWYVRSSNGGDNWAKAFRVNLDGPGKHQFLPALTIDQINGNILIAYYDRRAYNDDQTDLYLAKSTDGGSNFTESKISDTPFVASEEGALGQSLSIAAHDGSVAIAWTRMDGTKTSVWAAVIKEDKVEKGK